MRYRIKNVDYMAKVVRVDGYKRALADLIGQLGIEFCIAMKEMFGSEEEQELTEAQIIFILGVRNQQKGCTTQKGSWSGLTPPVNCTVAPENWWKTIKPRLIQYGLAEEVAE